ncbi:MULTISPECIES: snapalysin [Streptomyces]|jgi:snapalysin|uniref:Extracellular small neutral protease n=1 Tax=Streptomyces doudnae TaxID=3075536 RepID=A0ABD5EQ58_9ACTN|nr:MULTISPECIES: snapalysin [unclassified Streptomyces]MDT0436823.1 snapalysin [Streptomyces sp. DSM 41981]MYQ63674.1 snapalysin [Streptomyces sp. SID4950]SCD62999.1 snapalysin [Streptomyces sp. SolWspMP-5a-2]
MRTSVSRSALALGLSLGLAALGAAVPASAAPAPQAATTVSGYTGSAAESKDNQAFFEAVLKSVAEKRAANPTSAAAVTVVYNASGAPTFSAQIARSAQIWNSAVTNVKLQAGTASNANFSYREGNDSRGSYASTNGHGSGYVFLDYAQNQQYDSTRVTAHETGHVLGLPDHYSGPCSELMSGGGPGTSCTNSTPNAAERARVNQLWANGLAAAMEKALAK